MAGWHGWAGMAGCAVTKRLLLLWPARGGTCALPVHPTQATFLELMPS